MEDGLKAVKLFGGNAVKNQNVLNLLASVLVLGLAACSPKSQNQNTNSVAGMNGVINGIPVEATDALAKSTVFLYVGQQDDKGQPIGGFGCTGTIIAENLIVTAGHCVPDPELKNFRFVIGFNRDLDKVQKEEVREVKNFIAHPFYGKEKSADDMYDIALVSFEGTIPAGYAPAKLLEDNSKLTENAVVTVSGYGLVKREGDVMEPSQILRKGPAIFLGFGTANEAYLEQSQNKTGGGACSGDSGGPSSNNLEGTEYVWGVASRVGNPDDPTKPCNGMVIYTSIASQKYFLDLAKGVLLSEITPEIGKSVAEAAQ